MGLQQTTEHCLVTAHQVFEIARITTGRTQCRSAARQLQLCVRHWISRVRRILIGRGVPLGASDFPVGGFALRCGSGRVSEASARTRPRPL